MKLLRADNIKLIFILGAILLLYGCNDNTTNRNAEDEQRFFDLFIAKEYPDLTPNASGLYIDVIKEGTGSTVSTDDWLLVNYVITSIPSSSVVGEVLDTYIEKVAVENDLYSSGVLYGPFKYKHGTEIEGVKEGMETMKEGGKSRFMFMSDLGYGSKGNNLIGPYVSLIYDVELVRVIGDVFADEERKIQDYMDTIPESKVTEIYDEETDATMYYIEDLLGTGDTIRNDSVASVLYRGYLCDKREFDSNIGGDTLDVLVGNGDVIQGWDIGLTYFRKGGKGRLVIPYQLAYGELGQFTNDGKVAIPPYETLIYDMEIVLEEE